MLIEIRKRWQDERSVSPSHYSTSTDEVSLSCVSKEPTEPVSCEATITVLKYKNMGADDIQRGENLLQIDLLAGRHDAPFRGRWE